MRVLQCRHGQRKCDAITLRTPCDFTTLRSQSGVHLYAGQEKQYLAFKERKLEDGGERVDCRRRIHRFQILRRTVRLSRAETRAQGLEFTHQIALVQTLPGNGRSRSDRRFGRLLFHSVMVTMGPVKTGGCALKSTPTWLVTPSTCK